MKLHWNVFVGWRESGNLNKKEYFMACKGCGSLPPVRIERTVSDKKLPVKKRILLQPKRKQKTHIVPKPANNLDRYRV